LKQSKMVSQQYGKGTIAILAAIAASVVVALFGVLQLDWWTGASAKRGQQQAALSPAPTAPPAPAIPAQTQPAEAPAAAAPVATPAPGGAETALIPSFDVVRVEPDGESVIAGRAAPGATIELLRDGQVHARTAADPSGLFAFVGPALPAGSHQVTLQAIAPDGTRERSRDNVTIVVAADRKARPLVTLTSPDKPTVVLSNPEPPPQVAQAAPAPPTPQPETNAPAPASPPPAAPAHRPDIKIVSVEAEDTGRLFVSGEAAPGATVRLYLNESFIAPGGVGGDGKVSFSIGRGMRPGDYRVRLDDVDPVSGAVRSRAEAEFSVPVQVASVLPPPAPELGAPPRAPGQAGSADLPAAAVPSADESPASAPSRAGTSQFASASPDGKELPAGTVVIPDVQTTIVSRGDNLWRMSQRIYGRGYRYTVIFGANQGQIRNPNRIYPGQVFVLPGEADKTP
jgi:nucleoid-associated protein YgaU